MRKKVLPLILTAATGISVICLPGSHALGAPKTLKWLCVKNQTQLDGIKKILDEYGKERNVKFTLTNTDWDTYQQKTLLNVAAGNIMDFYAWGTDFYAGLAAAKVLSPLDNYIKASKFDISKQNKTGLKAWQQKGQLWGMPYGFYPTILYYNKTLFDKAGVVYPTSNWDDKSWNWTAFLETAKKLTKYDGKGKITQAGVGGMQWHYQWPWYFGGDWTDEAVTMSKLNDPKTARGLQEVADLTLKYKVSNGGGFDSGKVGMSVDGCWGMSTFLKIKNFKWNVAASPWGTDNHSVAGYVDAFSIGNSKNRNQMWDFIRWVYQDKERVRRWLEADSGGAAVPTDKDLLNKYVEVNQRQHPEINYRVISDSIEYATPIYIRYNRNWTRINQIIDPAVGLVTSGKKLAKDALAEIHPQVDKLIKAGNK